MRLPWWANLLASAIQKDESKDDDFNLNTTYIEILHRCSRLDCELLEYIAEKGISTRNKVDGRLVLVPLDLPPFPSVVG